MLHNPEAESNNALPTVSVIVLNYNGKRFLQGCFNSLVETLNYPKERLQLIMVDNGSSDGSAEYMEANFPGVEIIRNSTNLGFAAGNNVGARQAKGQYLAFLNNDTRVHPDWLIELVRSVSREGDIVCAGGKILSWDGSKVDFVGGAMNFYGMGFQKDYGEPHSQGEWEEKEILFACGGSMLIRRETFLECGSFDEDYFAYFEDVDFGWRLWVLGYRVVFSPGAITYHRHQGTAKHLPREKRTLLYERNALYTIIKNYDEENLTKVLPVALLLIAKRMLIFSGIDPASYHLDLPSQVPASRRIVSKPLTKQVEEAIRYYGLLGLGLEVAQRTIGALQRRLRSSADGAYYETISKYSLAHLVALGDLLEALPSILRKREKIQGSRRRPDSEILPLFATPFHPHPPYPGYEKVQQRLAEYMGIYEIFERSGYETPHH